MQNSNEILLTIAIPTYNRAKYLLECFEHVLPQISKEDYDVEILVCDNASTDETPAIMREMTQKNPCIRYLRNEKNIGPDANFLYCLRVANGRYVHLLSDDDILLAGSVSKIKECIRKNPSLNLMFLNFYLFTDKFKEIENPPKNFVIGKDVIYKNPNKYIEDLHVHITFLSSLVFNKQSFNQIINPEKYIGTNLLQAHLAYKCLCLGENAIVAHACIAARCDQGGGYDFYKVFVYEWKKLLFETGLQLGLNKSSLKKIFTRTLKYKIRRAVRSYRLSNSGDYGLKEKDLLFSSTWMYADAWIFVYPYAFLPRNFIVGLKKTENFFKRMRKKDNH